MVALNIENLNFCYSDSVLAITAFSNFSYCNYLPLVKSELNLKFASEVPCPETILIEPTTLQVMFLVEEFKLICMCNKNLTQLKFFHQHRNMFLLHFQYNLHLDRTNRSRQLYFLPLCC